MAEHLTALDATFLELEQDDPGAHMHIGGLLVFEPRPDGTAPSREEMVAHLEGRLGLLPRYRQRLSAPEVHGLGWPTWEDVEGFDVHDHVATAALPGPGGRDELLAWASDYWSHRLDRRRPLWDVVLVEGLEGGRWALANRTHHCMVDGVGSMDVGYAVLDPTPEPQERSVLPPPPPPEQHSVRSAFRQVVDPRQYPSLLKRTRAAAEVLVRDEVIPAPHTSLNGPVGTLRRIGAVSIDLAELKAIKNALGGTVNDVVLALTTGALRSLLLYRGEIPPRRGMRAMVPMNIRDADEKLGLGNRVTSLFARLPVAEADPERRYATIVEETARLKAGREAAGAKAILDVTAMAPPLLHTLLARTLYAKRLFNVTITNVPGPPMPVYALGAKLDELFGLVPIFSDHAVGVCILSYAGTVTVTVNADRDSVQDLDVMLTALEESLDELRAVASRGQWTSSRSAATSPMAS